jgi:hypothetical protein
MLSIEKIDIRSKDHLQRFMRLPFRLYQNHPYWVPPLLMDVRMQLNPDKHPFYEHSEADFFIATRDGRDIGRIAALENRSYNKQHHKAQAQFYLFECEDDQEAADKLFDAVFAWAKKRGLDHVVGPKGFSPFDGYGILVEGFQHRQMMTMMNYNYPYYPMLLEKIGFHKEVDFVSCYLSSAEFRMPERVHRISERVQQRGTLKVHNFEKKSDLKKWAKRIGEAYNNTFVNNWEYYPLTDNEIKYVVDTLIQVADARLIKIITHEEKVVGFILGFPDVSAALQRARGKLFPFGLFHLLIEMRRTNWISLNGMGILPEVQGRGGNALMYSEMEKTIRSRQFTDAELTQVAETAGQMRSDLENVGAKPYKNHRVYTCQL